VKKRGFFFMAEIVFPDSVLISMLGDVLAQEEEDMLPGMMIDFAGPSLPSGFLACDGSAVSRSIYSALFAAIGTTWGPGDGSTTFNLPDAGGRVRRGADGLVPLGSTGGVDSFFMTVGQLPSHHHPLTDPGHAHAPGGGASFETDGSTTGGTAGADFTTGQLYLGLTDVAPIGITQTDDAGNGDPVPLLPSCAGVKVIIKT